VAGRPGFPGPVELSSSAAQTSPRGRGFGGGGLPPPAVVDCVASRPGFPGPVELSPSSAQTSPRGRGFGGGGLPPPAIGPGFRGRLSCPHPPPKRRREGGGLEGEACLPLLYLAKVDDALRLAFGAWQRSRGQHCHRDSEPDRLPDALLRPLAQANLLSALAG